MIGRVTQQGLQQASLLNLQHNLSRMAELQQRQSSGKLITKPSDDPAGMVDAMRIRSDQRATVQHARNAQDAVGWLSTVDSALTSSTTLLRKARDLVVRGASSQGASSREAIAAELELTAEALREQANTQYLGRSVFAGTSNDAEAFARDGSTDPVSYPYASNASGDVERRISANTTVQVNSPGAVVFGADPWPVVAGSPVAPHGPSEAREVRPDVSVFALLDRIAADLRSTDPAINSRATHYLDDIDARMDVMLKEVASAGTRYNQVLRAQTQIQDRSLTLETQLSSVEDADLAETIVDLKSQEIAYQGALNATSRALQPSLLDFLR